MTAINIVEYDEIAEQIETVKEAADFLPDVTTTEGYNKSKRVSLDIGKLKTALEKTRKEKKAYFIQGGKEVDTQAKVIIAKLEAIQLPHMDAYKELDNLKKEREAKRKEELSARVEHIRTLPEMLAESCSDEVKDAMQAMNDETCSDFYEFSELAINALKKTKEALALLLVKKVKEEQDAEELAKLKKEQAEREKQAHEDKIAREASAKAEAAAAEAVQAKEAAEHAVENAKLQAKAAEEARIKAEDNAKKQAEEAAEQARLNEIKRQEDAAKLEAEELAQREANKKHIGKIRGEAKESLMALGLDEKTAKKIVLAINNKEITNISIQY